MLKRIKAALDNITASSEKLKKKDDADSLMFAVAILLVEVMHADHQLDEQEAFLVVQLLQQQFELDESVAQTLFSEANEKMKDAVSLHQYTSRVNSNLSYQEKKKLMANLWRVVFADGQLDKYEEHLVRRVADLIHIGHKDFIKAKHLAQESLYANC